MKRQKSRIAVLGVILGFILSISMVNAYFEDSVAVTNHIALGDVNIGIEEYELKNGREVLFQNYKTVFPGEVISKIPRIRNYGKDCWVRVHISFQNDMQEIEGISEKNLLGMHEDWILIGEYYYYQKVLSTNASVDVFQEVRIPEQWDAAHSLQKLGIEIKAEAIQAANFWPDFSAMSPWGNHEIELCVHEENGMSACVKTEMTLSVEFNGDAHKLLAVPDNFFHNIKRAMPGDEYQDEVILSNTTDKDAELFFKTEIANQTEEQIDLLNKIYFKIGFQNATLYEGNLLAEDLKNNISLGVYEPEEQGKLYFQIRIPKELTNTYALREADVKWIFTVKETEHAKQDDSGEGHAWNKSGVKTGDSSRIVFWSLAVVCSAGLIIIGNIKRKKRLK